MKNLFKELGLSDNVLSSIEKLGYTTPSEIQNLIIPTIMSGKDALGQAKTGTGKTLAFAASILSKITYEKEDIKAIILCPTRELALQVSKEFKELDDSGKIDVLAVYGGSDIKKQIQALKNKPDIVIGTPGRVKDLIERRKLNLTKIDFFVLDEADEMLNMGFIGDIEEILFNSSRDKQVLMFSATMPKQVKTLVEKYMRKDYKHMAVESDTKTSDTILQTYYVVTPKVKLEVLCRVIDSKKINKSIIFVKTKRDCDELNAELQSKGYDSDVLHGDIAQGLRIKTLDRFKRGTFKYLIATDVAARGIHVDDIDLVINYHIPYDKESYVHRIGRTGRASKEGLAVSLITTKEKDFIKRIEKFTNSKLVEESIPERKDIMEAKYEEVLENALKLIEENNLDNELVFVRDLNKAQLLNLAAALLKHSVNKKIGSDFRKSIEIKERSVRSIDNDKKRVFVNVGKKDKLKKNDFIEFIVKNTGVDGKLITNVEMLEAFTFLDIDEKYAEKLISKLTGKSINNRKIAAEISTKKAGNKKGSRKPRRRNR